MALQSLGPGLQQFGGKVADFGLLLLKSGMDENKRIKVQGALQKYEEFLRNKGLDEDQIDAELTKATSEAIAGNDESAGDGAPSTEKLGQPSALGILRGDEDIPSTGKVISKEIEPGKPLTTLEKPTAGATELAAFESRIGEPAGKGLRQAAIQAGAGLADVTKLEESQRQRIIGKGKRKLEAETLQFTKETKKEELRLKELDIERKRQFGQQRNVLLDRKQKFSQFAKTRDWQLDEDIFQWKKTVKKEFARVRSASDAARKVKELQKVIADGDEKLRWNREFFEITEEARGTGFFNAIKDVYDPIEKKDFNLAGKALQKRIVEYERIKDDLIRRFNLSPDQISGAAGFEGSAELQDKPLAVPKFTVKKVQ